MRRPTYVFTILLVSMALSGCFGTPEDEDGLDAETERNGWSITIKRADGTTESRDVTSDPHKEDTDGDGIDDFQEMLSATDPRNVDTDGDGLKDGYDLQLDAGSDLAKKWLKASLAHERDGERITFFGEWDHQADPTVQDTDEDGLLDGDEVGGFIMTICGEERTVRTSARQPDSDNDIVLDVDEVSLGSDPSVADTDGDGVSDLTDVYPCGDLHVVFETLTFTPEGGDGPYEVHFAFAGDRVPWVSDPFEAGPGVEVDVAGQAGTVDAADGQGNARNRDFNVTLTIFVFEGEGDDRRTLRIVEGGRTDAVFRYDARAGHLTVEGQGPGTDATSGSSGPDGSVRITLKAQIGP